MTPSELDAQTVHGKLRLMRELLDDIEPLVDISAERLAEDRLTRHAVERVLTQLVGLAVAINGHVAAARLGRSPSDYRESFELAAAVGAVSGELASHLAPSVGLWNVLTHEYASIDLRIVAESIPLAVKGYRDYVRQVAQFLRGASR